MVQVCLIVTMLVYLWCLIDFLQSDDVRMVHAIQHLNLSLHQLYCHTTRLCAI